MSFSCAIKAHGGVLPVNKVWLQPGYLPVNQDPSDKPGAKQALDLVKNGKPLVLAKARLGVLMSDGRGRCLDGLRSRKFKPVLFSVPTKQGQASCNGDLASQSAEDVNVGMEGNMMEWGSENIGTAITLVC